MAERSRIFWRVAVGSASVFRQTRAASRAAALAFSSLLGLGPLVAIVATVAGVILGRKDHAIAAHTLDKLLRFVAPQLDVYDQLDRAAARGGHAHGAVALNPKAVEVIDRFMAGARHGVGGTLGIATLIVIALLLFDEIESAFNDIWGVKDARPLLKRITRHWLALGLTILAFLAAVALPGYGAFVFTFSDRLPHGRGLVSALAQWMPVFTFAALGGVLTLFYRYVPNARVDWRSAVAGAGFLSVPLTLNNHLAFLYVRRIVLTRDLYGSLALLPVLMIGLYVFWLCVLVGGHVGYSLQSLRGGSDRPGRWRLGRQGVPG